MLIGPSLFYHLIYWEMFSIKSGKGTRIESRVDPEVVVQHQKEMIGLSKQFHHPINLRPLVQGIPPLKIPMYKSAYKYTYSSSPLVTLTHTNSSLEHLLLSYFPWLPYHFPSPEKPFLHPLHHLLSIPNI